MAGKASSATRVQQGFSIIGIPGLYRGSRRCSRDRDSLLMDFFETAGLVRRSLDLEAARDDVRNGHRRPGFSLSRPALGKPQRVPAKAEPM